MYYVITMSIITDIDVTNSSDSNISTMRDSLGQRPGRGAGEGPGQDLFRYVGTCITTIT